MSSRCPLSDTMVARRSKGASMRELFMGKDGWGWSEGGKRFAWLGCLFFLVLGAVMVLTGGVFVLLALVTGNATVNVS